MKISLVYGLIFFLIALSSSVNAADDPLEFTNPAQEQRYMALIEGLRCLVCQNQSLADSNADLAQDLRQEVYRLMIEGDDNEGIIKYLVARYGDFVLYRPPFKSTTYLLWLAPIIFLIIGIWITIAFTRKQQFQALNEEEQEVADQMLNEDHLENKK
ncbi:MAG: cytochrome c-type biogenesis protein CcmH [Proteobacteria bacterium]|nr:cytochrome c-type biogenesis protein CcmH [Pseudomonadota bacterium]MCH8977551.1 cytochrome c-type biogenesis protein CcmH [Pseudomonadota bacterium]